MGNNRRRGNQVPTPYGITCSYQLDTLKISRPRPAVSSSPCFSYPTFFSSSLCASRLIPQRTMQCKLTTHISGDDFRIEKVAFLQVRSCTTIHPAPTMMEVQGAWWWCLGGGNCILDSTQSKPSQYNLGIHKWDALPKRQQTAGKNTRYDDSWDIQRKSMEEEKSKNK